MKKWNTERTKLLVGLILLIAALLLIGVLLEQRISNLLESHLESQMKLQAQAMAAYTDERFQSELARLKYMSMLMQTDEDETRPEVDEDTLDDMMRTMTEMKSDTQFGMLTLDGTAVYGEPVDLKKFSGVRDSFHGNDAVSFAPDEGLLFTVPVFKDGRIRHVLYSYYGKDELEKQFGFSSFNGYAVKAVVKNREGDIVIPFDKETYSEDMKLMSDEKVEKGFALMHDDMEEEVSAAIGVKYAGESYVLFQAEVTNTEYQICGFVKSDTIGSTNAGVMMLIIWVFGLLLFLFILGIVYIMVSSGKIMESDALREAKNAAENSSKAKSDFLANMSHEIRTPINVMLGMDELILREYTDPQLKQYAIGIRNAGKTLLSLINDILDFSKIEAGKMELIIEDYNLSAMVEDLYMMIKERADKKGLVLNIDVDPKTPEKLTGDKVRLSQCILNILTNAVKYTDEGSVNFKVGFEKENEDEIWLIVSVRDTGIGMPKDQIDKLFSPFERIEENRNRSIEGTGLGMSITRRLLDMMGTDLKVESDYGKGSTFSFRVKQNVVSWDHIGDFRKRFEESVSDEQPYREQFTASSAHVLVVDDTDMNLVVIKGLLRKTMMQVDTASSGYESVEKCRENEYDIILMDHLMPGMDGIAALDAIKKDEQSRNQKTPCIALTANAISGAKEMYIKAGFVDYLSKPVEGKLLEEMIAKYIPTEKVNMNAPSEELDTSYMREGGIREEVKEALRYCDDDRLLYVRMCDIYSHVEEYRRKCIEDSFVSGDMDAYGEQMAALAASAPCVGYPDLAEAAKNQFELVKKEPSEDRTKALAEGHEELLKKYAAMK